MSRRPYGPPGPLMPPGNVGDNAIVSAKMREMAMKVKRDSCSGSVSSLEYCAMLLTSDIGGTKTLLGLFAPDPDRPSPIEVGEFVTLDYDGLEPMVREFLGAWKVDPRSITAACIGVAGAVTGQVARLTNVPWLVDGDAVGAALGLKRAEVINDLEALAPAYVVAGHRVAGAPTDLTAITHTRDYLEHFEKTIAASAEADEAEASLLAAYPDAGLKLAANLGTRVAKGELTWG